MLGDLVLLRNRSRLCLHKLQPRWRNADPAHFGSKHVNADSNSQTQGSCQPRFFYFLGYVRRSTRHGAYRARSAFLYNIQGFLSIYVRCVTQLSERPEWIGSCEAESPAAAARCRFFGNEWKTRRADVPVTPSPTRAKRWCRQRVGGEGGIRTHDTLARIPVFETGTFNRSVTSPVARILPAR